MRNNFIRMTDIQVAASAPSPPTPVFHGAATIPDHAQIHTRRTIHQKDQAPNGMWNVKRVSLSCPPDELQRRRSACSITRHPHGAGGLAWRHTLQIACAGHKNSCCSKLFTPRGFTPRLAGICNGRMAIDAHRTDRPIKTGKTALLQALRTTSQAVLEIHFPLPCFPAPEPHCDVDSVRSGR